MVSTLLHFFIILLVQLHLLFVFLSLGPLRVDLLNYLLYLIPLCISYFRCINIRSLDYFNTRVHINSISMSSILRLRHSKWWIHSIQLLVLNILRKCYLSLFKPSLRFRVSTVQGRVYLVLIIVILRRFYLLLSLLLSPILSIDHHQERVFVFDVCVYNLLALHRRQVLKWWIVSAIDVLQNWYIVGSTLALRLNLSLPSLWWALAFVIFQLLSEKVALCCSLLLKMRFNPVVLFIAILCSFGRPFLTLIGIMLLFWSCEIWLNTLIVYIVIAYFVIVNHLVLWHRLLDHLVVSLLCHVPIFLLRWNWSFLVFNWLLSIDIIENAIALSMLI